MDGVNDGPLKENHLQTVTIDLYKIQADYAAAQRQDAETVKGLCDAIMGQADRIKQLEKENGELQAALATRPPIPAAEGERVSGTGES